MEIHLLKRKVDVSTCSESLVIYEGCIAGIIPGELYAVEVMSGGVFPISALAILYDFPKNMDALYYIKGYNPELFEKIAYYD